VKNDPAKREVPHEALNDPGANPAIILRMKTTTPRSTLCLLLSGFLLALAPIAEAFPKTKERADLTLTFTLSPTDPVSTASGTATIHVTRTNGVETDGPLDLTLSGLADGTYTVAATTKADPTGPAVPIGSIVLSANPDPSALPAAPLNLPEGLSALEIDTLTISDATPAIVLSGTASESVASWFFFGNRPLLPVVVASAEIPPAGHGKPVAKKLHGHVLIQAVIKADVEQRRKFLLVGHGLAPDTTLTVNLDGVAVGSVTTTKNGKAMLKSLDGDFLLAGVHLVSLSDADGNVVAEADFFPGIE
jgi:hypothetical protein